jgi:hypothetical protein
LLVKNTGLTPEFQGVDEDNGRALKITRNPLSSTKHDNGSEEQPMNKARWNFLSKDAKEHPRKQKFFPGKTL